MDMKKIAIVAVALLAGEAHAFSVGAIGSFFAKLFKGGAAMEAVVAGRAAKGADGAKGLEHLAAADQFRLGPAMQAVEPKPDMAADVMAKSRWDADAYNALRPSPGKGDTEAMLKMSEMTASGNVADPGESWRGFWMFRPERLGSQVDRRLRDECLSGEGRRATDRWFDLACGAADGRSLYIGDKLPGAYSPYRPDYLMKSAGLPGATQ